MAIIEFRMDGTILRANDSFLAVVGYDMGDVEGRHHRIFVEEAIADGQDYALLWQKLRAGEFVSGEFLRKSRSGAKVWLEATYNPVMGPDGKPLKIVKFAADVTAKKWPAPIWWPGFELVHRRSCDDGRLSGRHWAAWFRWPDDDLRR
ncbi:PAS domain-containing protein, partial [Methylorubrum rhodinum]|uniref:PAS domain-containing protein n=1 Tax=Methylorubrum rhodinum TaxID=29428 RepID=UPI003BB08CC0